LGEVGKGVSKYVLKRSGNALGGKKIILGLIASAKGGEIGEEP